MEKYLRPSEVAKLTKLNTETVYHYIKNGDLRAVRFRHKYIVFRRDLEDFIRNRKEVYQTKELNFSNEDKDLMKKYDGRSGMEMALRFHFGTYLIVNGFLVLIWRLAGGGYPWFLWVILGWGVLLFIHAFDLLEWNFFRARGVIRKPATIGLLYHTYAYVIVNSALALIWARFGGGYPWFLWALIGWGMGLAMHALSYFSFSCAR